jgi:hypothetical protein
MFKTLKTKKYRAFASDFTEGFYYLGKNRIIVEKSDFLGKNRIIWKKNWIV